MRPLVAAALLAAVLLTSAPTVAAQPTVGDLIKQGHVTQDAVNNMQANAKNENLMNAVRKNDPEMVARVLAASADPGEDILQIGGDYKTLLHYAAMWYPGKDAVVSALVEAGAPVDAIDMFGHTPIMMSATMGCTNVMKHLLVRTQPARCVSLPGPASQ